MQLLKARPIVKNIYAELKNDIAVLPNSPRLLIFQVGEDPASDYYVSNLARKGAKAGLRVESEKMSIRTSQKELLERLEKAGKDPDVHGLMVQKPLPGHIDELAIDQAVDPVKDVDGTNPYNLGKLLLGKQGFIPSTPAAVLATLEHYGIVIEGRHVVIIGRSNIVGKPLANLLLRKNKTGNATVTVCHSRTKELDKITGQADILIAAIGKAGFVRSSMIKKGAVLIDVGINLIDDPQKGSIYVGDIDFADCAGRSSAISPVPGGIGSVTTAKLLENVLKAYKNSLN